MKKLAAILALSSVVACVPTLSGGGASSSPSSVALPTAQLREEPPVGVYVFMGLLGVGALAGIVYYSSHQKSHNSFD